MTTLTMLCTDGSELATAALTAGLGLLAPADRTLVVTVVDPVDASLLYGASGLAGGMVDERQYQTIVTAGRDAAEAILVDAVNALGLGDVANVESFAVEGEPGQ